MSKMASEENGEKSVKSLTTDKMDGTVHELKTDEKKSSSTSLVDLLCNQSNNTLNAEEKKHLTSDVTNESLNTNVDEKDIDNAENKYKHDSKSPIIDKNEQNDNKDDKKQDIKQEAEKQEKQDTTLPIHLQNTDEGKDSNNEDSKDKEKEGYVLKRKRKTLGSDVKRNINSSSTPTIDSPVEESGTRSKRKKLKSTNDRFCWRCHKDSADVHCTACPRSWHRKCTGATPSSLQKWICGECATILRAENVETRSTAMEQLSVDQLCMLLKHVIERLRDYPGSEPFCKPVDIVEIPNYLDYVIKPMDLSLLESNVRAKLYGSTDAFMADAKWIQHNCIVFNTCGGVYTDTSKLTNAAKQIIKVARQEVSEIEACPDCYAHGRNLPRPQPSWFIEPCRRPHPLVWAKLKGFPFWPAKAMPRVNSQGHVDVRFFGDHERAWVAPKDLYLYSEEPPAPSSRKRKLDIDHCVREITRHCRKLEVIFGKFQFAPPKVQYNPDDPMQITLMLPHYNPLEPNNYLNSEFYMPKKKAPPRKRSLPVKDKSPSVESAVDNKKITANLKGNINSSNHEKGNEGMAIKVQKLDSNDIKNASNSQRNLSGSNSKLSKKGSEEIIVVAHSRSLVREETKSTRASPIKDNNVKNSNTSNARISDKSNLQKKKNEMKSITENLSKIMTSPTRESSDVAQKRNVLKNTNPKRDISQNMSESTPKSNAKNTKGSSKVYKPKTRMVDKLNAEKALKSISASKENDKLTTPNTSGLAGKRVSLLSNNARELMSGKKIPEIDITLSPPAASKTLNRIEPQTVLSTNLRTVPVVQSVDKSMLLLLMNNGTTAEIAKQQTARPMVNYQGNKDELAQRETREIRGSAIQKKESKAKKSFPNKSRDAAQVNQHPLPMNTSIDLSIQASTTKPGTSSGYQLLPPEAGPISARLYHSAQELAHRMGQLMEEAYKEAAEANDNGENGTTDNYSVVLYLRKQIEHMKWQHQQQMAELKHNADRTMREMRASLEAEKLRSIEETRRQAEEDKMRCIEEIKRKQWCAKCGKEALFYCCWNTAYCDYPCQQSHWPSHMRTCSQQPAFTTIVNTSSVSNANPPVQNNNTMVQDPPGRVYAVPCSKLSGIPSSWSTSSLTNKSNQDSL